MDARVALRDAPDEGERLLDHEGVVRGREQLEQVLHAARLADGVLEVVVVLVRVRVRVRVRVGVRVRVRVRVRVTVRVTVTVTVSYLPAYLEALVYAEEDDQCEVEVEEKEAG